MSSSRRIVDSVRRAFDSRSWSLRASGVISAGVIGGLLLVPATAGTAAAGVATTGAATAGVATAGVAKGSVAKAAPAANRPAAGVTSRLPAANSADRPMLKRGSRGHWVKVAQRKLGVAADGIFGPVTESAVIEFQREQGLLVDGIVGPQTWDALTSNSSGGSGGGDGGGQADGASAAVSYARAQVGDRYVYGGEGPDSFDCSGLTMRAWEQAGVQLPHSSQGQTGHGSPVSWSGLRPGDLLFFYSPISHVGIYVGDGEMVAASNPEDGVELVNIRSSYWRSNFATARRL